MVDVGEDGPFHTAPSVPRTFAAAGLSMTLETLLVVASEH